MASLHKPFLVAEGVLKRLEDAAWLSLTEKLQSRLTGQEHGLDTTHGRVPLPPWYISQQSFLAFSWEAILLAFS